MALKITITDAGRAEIVNAQNTGTAPVKITHVALEAAGYTPAPGQTALQNEIKRVSSIAGEVVADDTISVTAKDEGSDAYTVRGFGLITEHGTLFAVYSQADPIIEKASPSTLLLTIDVVFADIDATSLTFGDITFSNPPASTTVAGVVRLSSAVNSTAQNLAATPNAVKQANDNANSRLAKSANLSDLGNAGTARNNLGLGTAAQQDDARYAHRSNNLADLTAPATARSNLGLGTAATANTGTGTAQVPTTSQADGRYLRQNQNLSDLGNAATARNNLGLGTAARQDDARYAHRGNNLADLTNAGAARNNLGLGSAATANTGLASGSVPTIADADGRYMRRNNSPVSMDANSTEGVNGVFSGGGGGAINFPNAYDAASAAFWPLLQLYRASSDRRAQISLTHDTMWFRGATGSEWREWRRTLAIQESGRADELPNNSANSVDTTGFYLVTNATTNVPVGTPSGSILMHVSWASAGTGGAANQLLMAGNTGRLWHRYRSSGGNWGAWTEYLSSNRSVSAGNGLTGGGDLTANRTISMGTPSTVTSNTKNSVSEESHSHAVDITGFFTGANNAFANEGYQRLPSGLILQWGTLAASSARERSVTFPIAFPNNCRSVQITHRGDASNSYGAHGFSTTGFISARRADQPNDHAIWWTAIGH